MRNDLATMNRQELCDEIENLRRQLFNIELEFAKCAQGKSPCFYCANDDTCTCTNDDDCKFKWAAHI